jgi:hypothetical protein
MMKRRQAKKKKAEEVVDYFGSSHPKKMPGYFFHRALHLSYKSAKRASVQNQNYSVAPRHWYIDADFKCEACLKEFTWSAQEQRTWFERYKFYVDSCPRHCPKCRAKHRHLAKLQREYDAVVGDARNHGSIEDKSRIIEIVEEFEESFAAVSDKMRETRDLFARQIESEPNKASHSSPDRCESK